MSFSVGDRVRVKNPDKFSAVFARKIRDRPGVVEKTFVVPGFIGRTIYVVRFDPKGKSKSQVVENFQGSDLVLLEN
jgi:hypothetical protein